MLKFVLNAVLLLLGAVGFADDVRKVDKAARSLFTEMPQIEEVSDIAAHCGARKPANQSIVYCTRNNTVYIAAMFWDAPQAPYALAHMFGHAAQVRHGIADLALSQIRQRPDEEKQLRGLVERQVHCLAGVYYAKAGLKRTGLLSLYDREPFTEPHWGRGPISAGPAVSIGMEAANEWFQNGQRFKDPLKCSVGELSAERLGRGLR
ncbi:MAG: hypothetical protein AAF198_06590 [Pseudomonadota bacterium]